jgi:hypothetical protein
VPLYAPTNRGISFSQSHNSRIPRRLVHPNKRDCSEALTRCIGGNVLCRGAREKLYVVRLGRSHWAVFPPASARASATLIPRCRPPCRGFSFLVLSLERFGELGRTALGLTYDVNRTSQGPTFLIRAKFHSSIHHNRKSYPLDNKGATAQHKNTAACTHHIANRTSPSRNRFLFFPVVIWPQPRGTATSSLDWTPSPNLLQSNTQSGPPHTTMLSRTFLSALAGALFLATTTALPSRTHCRCTITAVDAAPSPPTTYRDSLENPDTLIPTTPTPPDLCVALGPSLENLRLANPALYDSYISRTDKQQLDVATTAQKPLATTVRLAAQQGFQNLGVVLPGAPPRERTDRIECKADVGSEETWSAYQVSWVTLVVLQVVVALVVVACMAEGVMFGMRW